MLVCILFSTFRKPNKKYISSLRLRSNYPTSAMLEKLLLAASVDAKHRNSTQEQ